MYLIHLLHYNALSTVIYGHVLLAAGEIPIPPTHVTSTLNDTIYALQKWVLAVGRP